MNALEFSFCLIFNTQSFSPITDIQALPSVAAVLLG